MTELIKKQGFTKISLLLFKYQLVKVTLYD